MSPEDSQRGENRGNRKGGVKKFTENKFTDNKSANYSPSASFNYNQGSGSYKQHQSQNQNQHPRRRSDRYKRESLNQNDRLAKQNDIIIRLLKEIRDRLPDPSANKKGPKKVKDDVETTAAVVENVESQDSPGNES